MPVAEVAQSVGGEMARRRRSTGLRTPAVVPPARAAWPWSAKRYTAGPDPGG